MYVAWNTEIVNRIKTGSITNVILFGDSTDRVRPPYIVVKPMGSGDRKLYQIFVHGGIGAQDFLEAYVFNELPELLKEPLEIGDFRTNIKSTGSWTGPYVDEGDNTLAMSRYYYIPLNI